MIEEGKMNENLKKILTSVYSNKGNLESIAKEIFCSDIKDNSSTSDILAFLDEGEYTSSFKNFISFVKYNNNLTDWPEFEDFSDEQKNKVKTAKTAAELITTIKDLCLEKGISMPENFEDNYNKLATGTNSRTAILIACLLIYRSTLKINPLFVDFVVDVIGEIEEKGSSDIGKSNILKLVNDVDPSLVDDAKKILRQYSMMTELAYTSNLASYIKTSTNNSSSNNLQYFDDIGENQNLIVNDTEVIDSPTIIEAISNFDMKEKSNLIRYALYKIEEKVKASKLFAKKEIQPAKMLIFLTLCDQLGKEVDENLLFAFTNPIYESMMTNSIPSSLDKVKDIIKEISGKEVEYVSEEDEVKKLREKAEELKELEKNLNELSENLEKEKNALLDELNALDEDKRSLSERESDLVNKENDIRKALEKIDEQQRKLEEKQAELERLESELEERKSILAKREEELEQQKKDLEEREKKSEKDEEKSDDVSDDKSDDRSDDGSDDEKDLAKIDNTLKNPQFLTPGKVWNYATKVLAGHCVYVATEYTDKGKATTEQRNILLELMGRSEQSEEEIIKAIKSKRSKIKKFSNTDSVNKMMENLIKIVKDIMLNLKNIRSELKQLKDQYIKEIDEDKKSEIADKFNDKKEEYENIKNYLFDILTPLIRDKVFRGITEFDDTNYADDAEHDGF